MNDRIWKDVHDLGEDFFYQLIGSLEGDVNRTHIMIRRTRRPRVDRGASPGSSVTWRIELGNHTHSTHHSIAYDFTSLVSCVARKHRIRRFQDDFSESMERSLRQWYASVEHSSYCTLAHQLFPGSCEKANSVAMYRSWDHDTQILADHWWS
jgi:hypothetical protein